MPDYDHLRYQELASISELAHTLSDERWDVDSLLRSAWSTDSTSTATWSSVTRLPCSPWSAWWPDTGSTSPRASATESAAYGSTHSPAQILAVFDTIPKDHVHKGISRVIKPQESLLDHIVHHQDIRRPLGLPRANSRGTAAAALGATPGIGSFVGAKKRAAGLRFVAPDVDWSHGDGPEVRGGGEAILLALTGRPVALDELSGDGAATLQGRIAA